MGNSVGTTFPIAVSFEFEGMTFHEGLRLDLLVKRRVVVELTSVEALTYVHHTQLLRLIVNRQATAQASHAESAGKPENHE